MLRGISREKTLIDRENFSWKTCGNVEKIFQQKLFDFQGGLFMGKYFIGALALLLAAAISACSDKDGAAAGKKANNDVYDSQPIKQSV